MNLLVRHGFSWSGRERNCCYLNTQQGDFAAVASVSGLDVLDDCRAVAVTDWDHDGKADLWMSSRTGSRVRFFHNRNSSSNNFVAFKLQGNVSCNRDAIGARLTLFLGPDGKTSRIQTLHAGDGFLSQSSKWVTFGVEQASSIHHLVVHWPNGETETIDGLAPNSKYVIEQGTGRASIWSRASAGNCLRSSEITLPEPSQRARIIALSRPQLPELQYVNADDESVSILGPEQDSQESRRQKRGVLVNLWSSSCQPCLLELQEFATHQQQLRQTGIEIVALCVDDLDDANSDSRGAATATAKRILNRKDFPFASGMASQAMVRSLDTLHQSLVDLQEDLPVPCSFLVANSGELVVLYKGPVQVEQLVKDADLLVADARQLRDAAVPFQGTWITKPIPPYPQDVALKLVEQGNSDEAVRYLRTFLQSADNLGEEASRADLADIHFLLGRLLGDRGDDAKSMSAYLQAIRINPNYRQAHVNLADLLLKTKRANEAIEQLESALKIEPDDPSVLVALGVAFAAVRKTEDAARCYRRALVLQPDHRQALANLARLAHAQARTGEAVVWYRELLKRHPESESEANNLAWILATDADPAIHNADEAVQWAEVACRITEHADPRYLTTLAAAYSEAGRFKDAILTANTAIRIAYAAGKPKVAATLEKHLRLYEAGKAYREGRQK